MILWYDSSKQWGQKEDIMKLLALYKNRKKAAALLLSLAVVLASAGCAQNKAPATEAAPAESATEAPAAQAAITETAAETAAPETNAQENADETDAGEEKSEAAEPEEKEKASKESGAADDKTPDEKAEDDKAADADAEEADNADGAKADKPESANAAEAADAASADQADIENNGGYFVRRGDAIYFRVYGPDGLPDTALWADFKQPVIGGSSAVWKLDLTTNQYEKLFDDGGWGGLWFFRDSLWLTRSTSLGDIVYSVDLDSFERHDLAWGRIKGVSEDGSHLVYEGYTDDGKQAFYITGEEDRDQIVFATENEYLTYCGVVGRDLYFLAHSYENDEGRDEFWQYKCEKGSDETELILLGTFPESEYGSSAQFVQFLAGKGPDADKKADKASDKASDEDAASDKDTDSDPDESKVYVSVEYREGTGHFYAGSHYAAAVPGKADSLELLDEEAAKADAYIQKVLDKTSDDSGYSEDPSTLKMYLDEDGKPAFARHLAGDLELSYGDGAFDLVLYDSPEDILASDGVTVFENWLPEFEYLSDDDISCNAQIMENVDGKVFTVYTESVRAPEDDIGWRSAYRLVRTRYEYFDPDNADSDTHGLCFIDSVDAGRPLDEEEIEKLNHRLDPDRYGFFLSEYHDPTEINWPEVFYDGAGIGKVLTEKQTDELLTITGEEELFTDVTAISGKDIKDFVQKTTGTDYEDAKYPLKGSWTYLPKDDLYAFQHGDTNAQQIEFENGWELGENVYRLHYNGHMPGSDFESWPYKATVRIEDGEWTFLSNLPE